MSRVFKSALSVIFKHPLFVIGFKKSVGSNNDGGHLIFRKTEREALARALEFVNDDCAMKPLFFRHVQPVAPSTEMLILRLEQERHEDETNFYYRVSDHIRDTDAAMLPKCITRCRSRLHNGKGDEWTSCPRKGCQGGFKVDRRKLAAVGAAAGLFEYSPFDAELIASELPMAKHPIDPKHLFSTAFDGWDHGRGATMEPVAADFIPDLRKCQCFELLAELDVAPVIAARDAVEAARREERAKAHDVHESDYERRRAEAKAESVAFMQKLIDAELR